jgi:hypothetical protein
MVSLEAELYPVCSRVGFMVYLEKAVSDLYNNYCNETLQ